MNGGSNSIDGKPSGDAALLTLENPWSRLPTVAPFVLPEDQLVLERFRRRLIGDDSIRTEVLPEPFYGSRSTSRVVLLALNPGFAGNEVEVLAENAEFGEQNRRILTFESRYPFFHLDPALSAEPGHRWWRPRLTHLIEAYGLDAVAQKLMVVQFFPYHSKTFRAVPELLPSQRYSFHLVEEAVRERKIIVIMRSRAMWLRHVPLLRDYPYIELRFPRNPRIATPHMSESEFEALRQAFC